MLCGWLGLRGPSRGWLRKVINFSYPSTRHPIEQLVDDYLVPLLAEHGDVAPHIVTHSFGGILVRYHADRYPDCRLGRVVMISPAHHGSRMFDIYNLHPFFLMQNGPVALQSGTGDMCLPCRLTEEFNFECGIIAGGIPSDPLSSCTWLGHMMAAHPRGIGH
jgi:pimeloyl-ACP methyl ester carboxylesterase